MIRTAVFLAALTATSIPSLAQTPTAQTISITGCVAPVQRDGSLGAKGTGTTASPETAATEANNPEPTGRFMLVDAVMAGSDGKPVAEQAPADKPVAQKATSYALRGQEQEIAKHRGHRVHVTGSLMPPLASKLPAQAAETADGIRTVQVASFKMVGANCSASNAPKP